MDKTEEDKVPNPGPREAIDAGCTCPVLDNSHGRGCYGNPDMFVMVEGCPIHNPPEEKE